MRYGFKLSCNYEITNCLWASWL